MFQRTRNLKKSPAAFTLIELLIVVAIIAILAAIAVPNFLEAQTRAKVSRVLNDMRTLRTGLEAYRVDYTTYPETDPNVSELVNGPRGPFRLTTPVAYLTSLPSSPFNEVFGGSNPSDPRAAEEIDGYLYTRKYLNNPNYPTVNNDYRTDRRVYIHLNAVLLPPSALEVGEYGLKSVGPNSEDDRHTIGNNARPYDPTNGTVSAGDIITFSDIATTGKNV